MWSWDDKPYRNEYQLEHQNFLKSIRDGKPRNDGVNLAQATMMAIMGRESAYTGKTVMWDDIMESNFTLAPDNLETWDGSLRPVPKPGDARG